MYESFLDQLEIYITERKAVVIKKVNPDGSTTHFAMDVNMAFNRYINALKRSLRQAKSNIKSQNKNKAKMNLEEAKTALNNIEVLLRNCPNDLPKSLCTEWGNKLAATLSILAVVSYFNTLKTKINIKNDRNKTMEENNEIYKNYVDEMHNLIKNNKDTKDFKELENKYKDITDEKNKKDYDRISKKEKLYSRQKFLGDAGTMGAMISFISKESVLSYIKKAKIKISKLERELNKLQ